MTPSDPARQLLTAVLRESAWGFLIRLLFPYRSQDTALEAVRVRALGGGSVGPCLAAQGCSGALAGPAPLQVGLLSVCLASVSMAALGRQSSEPLGQLFLKSQHQNHLGACWLTTSGHYVPPPLVSESVSEEGESLHS